MNFSYELDTKTNTVLGKYGLYIVEAKINFKPMHDGIANGRVYVLSVFSGESRIIHYDCEWKKGNNYINLIQRIVTELEKIQPSKIQRLKKLVTVWK
ncbi:hypothetical protein CN692_24125 [Bacillus sp. AFS002410]|uniref:hypothetical protein n=1 Tax=Bacillus sp. AFS002410 TaxID=2033481 RepID=UPI000BF21863|nr:hypothetical protein [Bacillus sp. AFS002410]PEJ48198.1 hypothetical protein CN692_24125 [Bacillus sp. AFS002410]